jgi:hypothetical protein
MDEVSDLHERIAKRADLQRGAWLHQLRRRYSVLMFVAGAFVVPVTTIAILARSILFGVVGAFLSLFACNRYMERKRVDRWLSRPTFEGQDQRIMWARIFYHEIRHPSVWLRITEWISAIVAVILIVVVSVFVMSTAGLKMRLLYESIYFVVGCRIFLWLRWRRQLTRELKTRIAVSGQGWSELT